jgi:tetratricopeptide (TPR) repeat protein
VQGYTRRQLKEDKIADSARGAMSWATDHGRGVLFTLIGLLLVVAIVSGFLAWNSRQTDQANIALSKAMRTFTAQLRPPGTPANETMQSFTSIAERGREAEKQFKDVADKYPYTKPAKLASYMAGAAAMQAGDNADAEKLLKSAANSRDSDIAALAKLALASFYRSTNRQADAARIYKELADHPTNTVSKSQAQLALAEMYEATDPKEAAAIYQQIQKENPNTPAAQIAASKSGAGAK